MAIFLLIMRPNQDKCPLEILFLRQTAVRAVIIHKVIHPFLKVIAKLPIRYDKVITE